MFTSHIHQKRKPRRPLPERIARANTRLSKIRAQVRACVRRAKAPHGPCRAHHRHRPRDHQDRYGQPCL
jgi:hypothetical protein